MIIFVSYAREHRSDVRRLKQMLESSGYDVRFDEDIEGGELWWARIIGWIQTCDVFLFALSPEATASDACRAEFDYALALNKPILPVLLKPAELPRGKLADTHYIDAQNLESVATLAALNRSLNHLQDRINDGHYPPPDLLPPEPAFPFLPTKSVLPPLSRRYIKRTALLSKLRSTVLDTSHEQRPAPIAVYGMGGIGKTMLTAALCRDPQIQAAYPDGIIWLKIGQTLNSLLIPLQIALDALGGNKQYQNELEAEIHLHTLLRHKAALIVLDDVWKTEHVRPFISEAPRSRILFTTRDRGIADRLEARDTIVDIPPMERHEALTLLKGITGRHEDNTLLTIAQELGYHPMALRLAGERIAIDLEPHEWLAAFQTMRTKFIKFSRDARNRDDNLEVCFDLSVTALAQADQSLYHALSIFPKDEWIPRSAVIDLWQYYGLSQYDARELIRQLVNLALAEQRAADQALTLHTLLHEYTSARLGKAAADAHGRLLDAWGDPREKPLPNTYGYRFYAHHLAGAGRLNFLRDLLLDYRWLHAKLKHTSISDVIADCEKLSNDEGLRLLHRVLRLAASRVSQRPDQLAPQILGRTTQVSHPDITALRNSIIEFAAPLYPINEVMAQVDGPLQTSLIGHRSAVRGALRHSNGRIVSWANNEATARLWSAVGEPLGTLEGHAGTVRGVRELHDGRLLSWGADGTLGLYQADDNGTQLSFIAAHTNANTVMGVLQRDDGMLVSWSADATAALWWPDSAGLELRALMAAHTAPIRGVRILPDGGFLTRSDDLSLGLWTAAGELRQQIFNAHRDTILGAVGLTTGNILSWSADQFLRLWTPAGEPLHSLVGHTAEVRGALELPGGRILSWSRDVWLHWWDPTDRSLATRQLMRSRRPVQTAIVLADGRILVGAGRDLHLWTADGEALGIWPGHQATVHGIMQLPDQRIASYADDGTIRLWTPTGELLAVFQQHDNIVRGLTVLPNDELLSVSDDKTLCIWNTQINRPPAERTRHESKVVNVQSSGKENFVSLSAHSVYQWNPQAGTGECLHSTEHTLSTLIPLADTVVMATQPEHSEIHLWDGYETRLVHSTAEGRIEGGTATAELNTCVFWMGTQILYYRFEPATGRFLPQRWDTAHKGNIRTVVGSADGTLLSWATDHCVKHWSPTGKLLHSRSFPDAIVRAAVIRDHLLVTLKNKTVCLCVWDEDNPLYTAAHTDYVKYATIDTAGRLITSDSQQTIRLWTPTGQLIDQMQLNDPDLSTWLARNGLTAAHIIRPDTKTFISTSTGRAHAADKDKHHLVVVDDQTGSTTHYQHEYAITALAVNLSGHFIAVGDNFGQVGLLRTPIR